jgi:folate-binding protein YgfZ
MTLLAAKELAADFGDAAAEERALAESAGLFGLGQPGQTRLTGPDRRTFLQGMVTHEVLKLPDGQATWALLLNIKGRVLAELLVVARADELLLVTDALTRERVPATLGQYLIMEEAELSDVTEGRAALSLQGPRTAEVLAGAGLPVPSGPLAVAEGPGELLVVGDDRFALGGGADLFGPVETLRGLVPRLLAAGAVQVGQRAVEAQRVLAGRPRYGLDVDDQHFPQEAMLDARTVSWDKGCYLGQEVVCRIKFRGHVNQRLTAVELVDGDGGGEAQAEKIAGGASLFAESEPGKPAGQITSWLRSPSTGRRVGLAYVRAAHARAGARLHVGEAGAQPVVELRAAPLLPL